MRARCKKCEVVFEAEPDDMYVITCPQCNFRMRTRPKEGAPGAAGAPGATPSSSPRTAAARTPSASPPAAQRTPSAQVGAAGAKLPSQMRANKLIAGKDCPGCGEKIQLGQEVHNCESCGTSQHAACWDSKGGCAAASCAKLDLKKDAGGRAGDDGDAGEDSKPCKYCGETIKASARKCRFCGEYLNARDRAAQEKAQSNPTDDNLSVGEMIFPFIPCLTIFGCIFGLVWVVQGKKKGAKMVALSILAAIIWNVVNVLLNPNVRR